MRRIFLLSVVFLIAFSSCSVQQELQYKGYDHFSVTADKNDPKVNINLRLFNPNPVGVKLKEMNLVITVNDTLLGTAELDHPVRIKRKQEFTVPVTFMTSMDQLNSLMQPGLEALLFNRPLSVEITGNMTFRKFIFFKKTLEFNYADELNIGDIKF